MFRNCAMFDDWWEEEDNSMLGRFKRWLSKVIIGV